MNQSSEKLVEEQNSTDMIVAKNLYEGHFKTAAEATEQRRKYMKQTDFDYKPAEIDKP